MKRILIGSCILLSCAFVQGSPAITGKWEGTTRSGTSIVLDLTATDTTLTGTLTRGDQTVAIADGKVSKTGFTFKATINDQAESFTGEPTGDDLKVWLDRQGPETAVIFKRVKKAAGATSFQARA